MEIKDLLQILGISEVSSICGILKELGVESRIKEKESVLFFKHLERILIEHYRNILEVDISGKIYTKKEIVGLVVFLYIKNKPIENGTLENGTIENGTIENGTIENDTIENDTIENDTIENDTIENDTIENDTLEDFFDSLFFSKTKENDLINELKEENRMLREEIERENQTEEILENVDYEVLKKLEKENIFLKETIQKENDVILKAWYNLCEEHIKNNL
ncbi:Chloride channel protein D [Nosema granulosis]|uniref:Chloride channel protein D n=1 Tax=Nosema granulosis TaxID=83296 RepID=A0A9P6GYV5_9MICR|nr:Chloride channel protein D [Nosema granulosis]